MTIPTEPIGSIPRPIRLIEAVERSGPDAPDVIPLYEAAVRDTIRANRHPLAAPVDLETKVSDFHDWARGAAVLAIQVLVLGSAAGRSEAPRPDLGAT